MIKPCTAISTFNTALRFVIENDRQTEILCINHEGKQTSCIRNKRLLERSMQS